MKALKKKGSKESSSGEQERCLGTSQELARPHLWEVQIFEKANSFKRLSLRRKEKSTERSTSTDLPRKKLVCQGLLCHSQLPRLAEASVTVTQSCEGATATEAGEPPPNFKGEVQQRKTGSESFSAVPEVGA